MNPPITITLSTNAQRVADQLDPARLLRCIAKELDRQNQITVAHIQRQYLSFPRQSPPTMAGLRTQSNRYRQSLRASKSVITDDGRITSGIGSNVTNKGFSYPALHEFGGSFSKTSRAGVVRLRTDQTGALLRQANGRLAVFAKNSHKQVREVAYKGGKVFAVRVPARAPIQRGITDRLADYSRGLSAAIEQEVESNG